MLMTPESWQALLNRIRSNDPSLTHLDLQRSCIGNDGLGAADWKELRLALNGNNTLIHLNLSMNHFGAAGAEEISRALNNNKTLIHLNLGGNNFGAAGAEVISRALNNNKTLIYLDLSNNQIGDVGAKDISRALNNNKILIHLNLSNNQIGDAGVKDLSLVLKDNKTLASLDLKGNLISTAGAEDLSRALKNDKTLIHLNLSYTFIEAALKKEITGYLHRNGSLRDELHQAVQQGYLSQVQSLLQQGVSLLSVTGEKDYGDNTPLHWAIVNGRREMAEYLIQQMREQGLPLNTPNAQGKTAEQLAAGTPLANLFVESTSSQSISTSSSANASLTASAPNQASLTTMKMTKEQWQTLLNRIQLNDPTLTTLDLEKNQIGDEGVKQLVTVLKYNHVIKRLFLGANQIGPEGARALAAILKDNKTLFLLNLSSNQIGTEGAKALAEAWKNNRTITVVGLVSNQIGDEGLKALAAAWKENCIFTRLFLNENQISDEGVTALGAALKGNRTLIRLGLGGNKIGAEGVNALATVFPMLTELDIGCNKIGDEGAKVLAFALKNNCTFETVSLWKNHIGDIGAKTLAAAFKDNRTLTELDLSFNPISSEGSKALVEILKNNRTLTKLDLNNIPIDSDTQNLIAKLLEHNKSIRQRFHKAVQTGRINQVKSLLQQGASILSTYGKNDNRGNTPLHWAVIKEREVVARYLIQVMKEQLIPLTKPNGEEKSAMELAQGTPLASLFETSADSTTTIASSTVTTSSTSSTSTTSEPQQTLVSLSQTTAVATPATAAPKAPTTIVSAATSSSSSSTSSTSSTSASASTTEQLSQPFPTKAVVKPTLSLKTIPWEELKLGKLEGEGGYGDVHKATWHGTPVAVKRLHLKKMTVDTQAAFDKETQIMAQCDFPHVIRLLGITQEGERLGLVMEYMPRGSLYSVLHNSKDSFNWMPTRWNVALDIGRGLSYLHAKNIIHRDLKSHNVLLDENYRAKISDFGLAKVKSETKTSTASQKVSTGTARWKAPELFKPKSSHSKETDVYSYGIVLGEIASRQMPFGDEADDESVKDWIKQGDKPELPDMTPDGYKNVIQQCYATDAAKRPTAAQAVEVLETAFLALPEPASAATKVVTEKSWHFDVDKQTLQVDAKKGYLLVAGGPKDCQKVVDCYSHHPVPGMDIKSVKVIYNPELNRGFRSTLALLQQRHNNKAFEPKWLNETNVAWRKEVRTLSEDMAKPYQDSEFPNVNLLPLWHGTKPEVLESLFSSAYANLAITDVGYFGKGIYSAHEAEYSHRVYSQGALILNWMAFFSAYPTIDGDMQTLIGKGVYGNYDAHFIPVVPESNDPNEKSYLPTKPNQKHTYTEVVVFDRQQCMPRYLVELQPALPKALNLGTHSHTFFSAKKAGKMAMQHFKAIDLIDAANYVYQHFLSKPYTLKTSSTGEDWSKIDWAYTYNGITIHRPNHSLRHTLSTAFYAPYVIAALLEHSGNKFTEAQRKEIEAQTTAIQLALLFFVVGRENEMGSQDDLVAYKRFRKNSAEAFEKYVKAKQLALFDQLTIDTYKDAIMAPEFKKSPLHLIIRVCHDIDTLRCLEPDICRMVMAAMHPYLGEDHCKQLAALVEACLISTGDRIRGTDNPKTYDAALFIESSTDVQKCRENIEKGIANWEAVHPKLGLG